MSKFLPGTVEKDSSTIIAPPAGIEPTASVRCRCTALTTNLRR